MKPSRNKPPTKQHPPTDWANVASWYDQLVGESGSEFHQHVVLPGTLRLLNMQPNEKLLDVACGQGVLCRIVSERGVQTVGVDSAHSLIDIAIERNKTLSTKPTYHVGDARELGFLLPNHFDAAACVLAIQNIHPIQPVCASTSRTLKIGGRFVIILMHPCFRGTKESSWGWDETNKIQYRRVDRYLLPRKSPIVAHPGKKDHTYTWTFHKPIESYIKSLRNAGLLVDAIEEWPSHKTSQPGPRQAAENQARKEIPMFMAIRSIKVREAAILANDD